MLKFEYRNQLDNRNASMFIRLSNKEIEVKPGLNSYENLTNQEIEYLKNTDSFKTYVDKGIFILQEEKSISVKTTTKI